jgi:hypothetical protein
MQAQSLFVIHQFPVGKKSLGVVVVSYRLIKNFMFGAFLGIK